MSSVIDVDRLEFVVLAEQAGINRVPLVASFSHYGTAVQDVGREFEQAERRCRQRGLLDRVGRVSDEAGNLLGLYPHTAVEYDLRFSAERGTELRAAVSRAGDVAMRTVVVGDRIHLAAVRAADMIPALVSVLPEVAPARMRPVGIDLAAMRAAMAQADAEDQRAVETALRSHGVDTREYRKITRLLDGPKFGAGEVGVTIWGRNRKEHRGEQTVQVFDLEAGRVAVYNSSGHRMLAGADIGTFNRLLGEITTHTRSNIEQ
ncbi:ESX secretion-associated protein EspG [Haloactinomyces albus]|uniref:EspG family protein n=1 Tax=Haloactinomyces albus TaxID=1352928 RepID=A0AAE3ZEF8_9ACTN|nr:ESX secretion-associated protein EspG [Haloactinomyces albus]MDR7301499.1 hypothetical protein [Haloactinomyces albus]